MVALAELSAPVAVDNVYITDELIRRAPKMTDYRREKQALQDLARQMIEHPADVLPRLVDLAIELCGGISGGISLYESSPAPGVFRWHHLRGKLMRFTGATTPRNFSPCGVTLDLNQTVLVQHPERVYTWLVDANVALAECLLVPLYIGGSEPFRQRPRAGDDRIGNICRHGGAHGPHRGAPEKLAGAAGNLDAGNEPPRQEHVLDFRRPDPRHCEIRRDAG
jgi:hypothetical protein